MPQRRINTPIPSFAAGWTDFPLVYTFETVTPAVIPVSFGRYRHFSGMVEFEMYLMFIAESPSPTGLIVNLPVPTLAYTGFASYGRGAPWSPDISESTMYLLTLAPDNYSADCDDARMDFVSGTVITGAGTLGSGLVGSPVNVHISGYYPVAIP